MELSLERPGNYLFVRAVGKGAIVVVEQRLERSFVLTPETLLEAWPVDRVEAIEQSHIDTLLALKPEVVLLGTGQLMQLPSQAVLGAFLKRGVGMEAMDNAAAARTYNVLAGEGRRVAAAFILPGAVSRQP